MAPRDVRIFRIEFNVAKIIIIFLISAVVIAIPNIAYSQPIPYSQHRKY
jgi:hypothetical protein